MDSLLASLAALGIKFDRYDHPPVTTVDEAMKYLMHLPGTKIKNLILQDKTGKLYLIMAKIDTKVNINELGRKLGAPGLKKADSTVFDYLKIMPGSVCPFAMINDTESKFVVCMDPAVADDELLMFHPMQNDASIVLSLNDLTKYMTSIGHSMQKF
jgi:Ala-tRNA(Pro) deacylase